MTAKVTFAFTADFGRSIPRRAWDPILGTIDLETMVAVFGSPGELTPDQFFDKYRLAIEPIAARKCGRVSSKIDEPLEITLIDFSIV